MGGSFLIIDVWSPLSDHERTMIRGFYEAADKHRGAIR